MDDDVYDWIIDCHLPLPNHRRYDIRQWLNSPIRHVTNAVDRAMEYGDED